MKKRKLKIGNFANGKIVSSKIKFPGNKSYSRL